MPQLTTGICQWNISHISLPWFHTCKHSTWNIINLTRTWHPNERLHAKDIRIIIEPTRSGEVWNFVSVIVTTALFTPWQSVNQSMTISHGIKSAVVLVSLKCLKSQNPDYKTSEHIFDAEKLRLKLRLYISSRWFEEFLFARRHR